MKTLRLLPLAALSLAVGLMTSCDSTTSSSSTSPTITNLFLGDGTGTATLAVGGGTTGIHATVEAPAGMQVTFTVKDGTGKDVTTNFTITYSNPGNSATSWSAFNDGNASIKALTGAANGTDTLILTATAAGASSSAKAIFVVSGGSTTPTGTATTLHAADTVYDVNGKYAGAFDLVSNAHVSSTQASTTKDLLDLTQVGYAFDGELGSGNGAKFVKNNSFDFANATKETIQAAFVGTGTSTTGVTKVGDIFIVKTVRGTTTYYVAIKFTAVKAETGTANDGYVVFDARI